MRDAMYSADPAREEWKQRVAEFAGSELFDRLFKEGMGLVEEAASYLDGPGRVDSRKLNRELALVYAAESMEVTTRLMQAASWLVVQRAVREKDMKVEEAGDEKYRLARTGEPHPVDRSVMPAPADVAGRPFARALRARLALRRDAVFGNAAAGRKQCDEADRPPASGRRRRRVRPAVGVAALGR